jgi:hypothetical protein
MFPEVPDRSQQGQSIRGLVSGHAGMPWNPPQVDGHPLGDKGLAVPDYRGAELTETAGEEAGEGVLRVGEDGDFGDVNAASFLATTVNFPKADVERHVYGHR